MVLASLANPVVLAVIYIVFALLLIGAIVTLWRSFGPKVGIVCLVLFIILFYLLIAQANDIWPFLPVEDF